MPQVQKPAFEQFRHVLTSQGKPLLEKNVQPIQAAIVKCLDEIEGLLIEKTRRLPHPEGMIEISAKWLGLDSRQDEVLRKLKKAWPDEVLGAAEAMFTVLPSEEAILLMFAGRYEDGRYLTGRMLITF